MWLLLLLLVLSCQKKMINLIAHCAARRAAAHCRAERRASIEPSDDTSKVMALISAPAGLELASRSTAAAALVGLRHAIMTRKPRASSCFAVSKPRPALPPVTTTSRFVVPSSSVGPHAAWPSPWPLCGHVYSHEAHMW